MPWSIPLAGGRRSLRRSTGGSRCLPEGPAHSHQKPEQRNTYPQQGPDNKQHNDKENNKGVGHGGKNNMAVWTSLLKGG